MHCQPHHSPHDSPRHLTVVEPARDPNARVGDADREGVAQLLADAAATGYLSLEELDQRLAAVWSATTSRELSVAESDLPVELRSARAQRDTAARARADARARVVPHIAAYAAVTLLLLMVWLIAGFTGGGWYPWPIWPALGWGIGLLRHVRAAAAPGTS